LGNYEESAENNKEKPERSQNDSRTTESPTRPETDLSLSTSDEIATVTTAISDTPPTEDD